MARRRQEVAPVLPPKDPKDDERLQLAGLSANAFHASARPFVQYLSGLSTEEAKRQGKKRLGEVIVAATNLSFSIELYLKALCLLEGKRPPGGHDLWEHYNKLSKDRQATIETFYAGLPKTRGKPRMLVVDLARTGDSTPPPPSPETPSDVSFRTVLEDSKDVFVHWRYFYQASRPEQIRTLAFDFFCLGLIADTLNTHLTNIIGHVVTEA